MTLEKMISVSYGHFLTASANREAAKRVFIHYAEEQLALSGTAAQQFQRKIPEEADEVIESQAFDRFYTWYFINYVIEDPVDDIFGRRN
jgi:hypothetical protein